MSVKLQIEQKRPKITASSLKAYLNTLSSLKQSLQMSSKLENTKFLENFSKIMKKIDESDKITTQKNKLTAIIVALDSDKNPDTKLIKNYQDELKIRNEKYNEFLKKQEKTETQERNWISYQDILNVINDLTSKVKTFKNKDKINKSDFNILQNLVLVRTFIEYPIRNNFANMKVVSQKDYDDISDEVKNDNNYLVKDTVKGKNNYIFKLNNFKNVKKIGRKSLSVMPKIGKLLDLWFKFNTSGYFIVGKNDINKPVSTNQITKYFNSIFLEYFPDKSVSSSILRHIIISHFRKGDKTLLEKDKKAKDIENRFLHSLEINDIYRKVD